MKINKIILGGIILILFSGLLFVTDIFTPYIRPITYIFLMGSSKGKDILFFALFGIFLILSQMIKIRNFNSANKYLKIAIYLFGILYAITFLLEIYVRQVLNVGIFTIFVAVQPDFATTSILHTHLLKSILGEGITLMLGSLIGSGINTASTLYSYIQPFAAFLIALIIALVILLTLSLSRRTCPSNIILSFSATIALIGLLDGGFFSVPSIIGFVLLMVVYETGYDLDYYIAQHYNNNKVTELLKKHKPEYKIDKLEVKITLRKLYPYIIGAIIVFLRLSLGFVGSTTEYYEVDIMNPDNNVTLDEYPVEKVVEHGNRTIYYITPAENEHDLTMNLSDTLNHSCDYYTVSWNSYSFL